MKQKRSRLIVERDRKKQVRYGLINVAVVLFLILILGWATLYSVFERTTNVDACDPSGIGAALSRVDNIWIATTLAVVLTGALCFMYILFLTHRFLGPIVAVSRRLDEMIDGDFDKEFTLRSNDELVEIAEKLNELSHILQTEYVKK